MTAKHAIANNLSSPVVVSSQYFLDCKATAGCVSEYYSDQLINMAMPGEYTVIPLASKYGPETGKRGRCNTAAQWSANSPKIIDYDSASKSDIILESRTRNGPTFATLYIARRILMFYTAGVVSFDNCMNYEDAIRYHTAVTGFSRVGQNGSGPYWQVRGSFGTSWGMNGLMQIEKTNGSDHIFGACSIHLNAYELRAKKY